MIQMQAAVAGRKRQPPAPPPAAFNPRDLFGETDDGILLLPQQMASIRKRINGEEPSTAADDLVGVAIDYRYALARGSELISDPALATSTGWGWTAGANQWSHAPGGMVDFFRRVRRGACNAEQHRHRRRRTL